MIKSLKYCLIILLLLSGLNYGQTVSLVKEKFESFEYSEVISLINKMIPIDTSLTQDNILELYTMKAVSYFSTAHADSARATFIDILKVDPAYSLDPVLTSPKILSFFQGVKNEFNEIYYFANPDEQAEKLKIEERQFFNYDLFSGAVARSLFLPGWGHLYSEASSSGYVLTSLSSINLGALVYYIIESNNKEKEYMNETDLLKISAKYNSYNSAYKIRNVLIASYAVIWLYSQVDIIFNSSELFYSKINPELSVSAINNSAYFQMSFKIRL